MLIGQYRFQPSLIATILVFVGVAFLIWLGNWQLDRATEKEAIINAIELRQISSPLTLAELNNISDKNFYQVGIEGQFDNKHYLLLDNRILKGRVGYEVIQPFISNDGIVLVNRGWVPSTGSREELPIIPKVNGTVKLIGEVHLPRDSIVLVKDELSASKDWPQLIQSIDLVALKILYNEISLSIEPWILRQKDDDPYYQRFWININMSPDKHVSYAVTWFLLALGLIIIYIAAVTSREELDIATNKE